MKWYWKARMYRPDGQYAGCEIETARNLDDINIIQDFYHELTGYKLMLEGMSEAPYDLLKPIQAFNLLRGES